MNDSDWFQDNTTDADPAEFSWFEAEEETTNGSDVQNIFDFVNQELAEQESQGAVSEVAPE